MPSQFTVGLPPLRLVQLPGRGTVAVREWAGPPDEPVVVLVHGVALTADLNWSRVAPVLGQRFRVIAFDQRGHGRGIAPGPGFRLEDCADDIAALVGVLGIEKVIAVGYSMGGLVAQLLWRQHRCQVAGLVLCSTARNFRGSPAERLIGMTLPAAAAVVSMTPALHWFGAHLFGAALLGYVRDPAARQLARTEMALTRLSTAVAAAYAVSEFTSHDWIGRVDVPTAVIVTAQDHLVPPTRQRRLARAIPGALIYELDGDHGVFLDAPGRFAASLLAACTAVAQAGAVQADPPVSGRVVASPPVHGLVPPAL